MNCNLCGGKADVVNAHTDSGTVTYGMCPSCDRMRCRECNLTDIGGTSRVCRGCGRPIGIHAWPKR